MKSVDVKSNTYINSSKEINDKDRKFKTGYTARISQYKNIFGKNYTPNWCEEAFVIKKKLKTLCHGHVVSDLNGEEFLDRFTKKNCKKRIEKLNGIKVQVFFEQNMERKHLCCHDKNYCFFCKSNIPRTNLIVGSKNISQFQAKLTVF